MTIFTFDFEGQIKTLENGSDAGREVRALFVRTDNDPKKYPFGYDVHDSTQVNAAAGSIIYGVDQKIEYQRGTGKPRIQLRADGSEFPTRNQIITLFIDLVSLANTKGPKGNGDVLKRALFDILDAQPGSQELNKYFEGRVDASYTPGIPGDGTKTEDGQISVMWNIIFRKLFTAVELDDFGKFSAAAISDGKALTYVKS